MAKKFGFGALLAFGTVAAVLGGAAAYLNRKSCLLYTSPSPRDS